MKKPAPLTFLIGTKRVCAVASVSAVLMVYGWYSGQLAMPWFLPLIAVVFACKTFKAKRQVEVFKAWQRQWNEMAGISEPARTRRRKRPWAITIWFCLLLYVVARPYSDPAFTGVTDVAFTISTLWLAGKYLWRWARWMGKPRTKSAATNPHIARICLPVPSRSPTVPEITAALPDYCQALLSRQATAPEKKRA